MNRKIHLGLSIILLVCILSSMMMGCSSTTPAATSGTTAAPAATSGATAAPKIQGMPIVTDGSIKLTWWQAFHPAAINVIKSLNDVKAFIELQKITGIKIEFQSPPLGQENEAFSTMIAARNIPDIMNYDILRYPGGPTKAISDKVIMNISDLLKNYSPNVNALFDKWPETRKDASTDDGAYFMFPSFNEPNFMVTNGLCLRQDWLTELGLKVPETIDEWYTALKAFKDKKGVTIPFTMEKSYIRSQHYFVGAYNTTMDFWRDANTQKVKFGPVESGYKDFLATMQKWYAEGLIDSDFSTQNRQMLDAKMINGKAGSSGGFFASGLGAWLNAAKDDKAYDLVFAKYPSLKTGETVHFSNWQWPLYKGGGLISANNKYPVETARMLDYIYGDEGSLLMNLGIEGDSYTMINGYPTLTDKMTKSDKTIQEMLALYTPVSGGSIFYQFKPWFDQVVLQKPQQADGNAKFKSLESGKWLMPSVTFNDAERKVVSQYLSGIQTYVDEMFIKFTLGQEPMQNYDKFVSTLESMNYKGLVAAYQSALDRYNKR